MLCYPEHVSGTYAVGGFCGYLESGAIDKCYATGTVEADESVGGFAGIAESDEI